MADEKQMTPPVEEGDIIESQEVINLGKHNDGVVKYENYIIFVAGEMEVGDIVSFKVDKVLPKFAIATKIAGE